MPRRMRRTSPPLLEHRSWLWPVMLFPHIERSHTRGLIGWRGWRPLWVRDVRYTSAGRWILTADYLHGRGNFATLWSWIDIPRRAIESVRPSPLAEGLLEVRFGESRKSPGLRLMTRGGLDGRVLLSLGDAADDWLATLGGAAEEET